MQEQKWRTQSPPHADTADRTGRIEQQRRKRFSVTPRSAVYPTRDRYRECAVCAARVFTCQGVIRSAVRFEARPFDTEFYGFVRTRRFFWEGISFPQPRAQRSEMILVCVVFVVQNATHAQDQTRGAKVAAHEPPALGWQGSRTVRGCYY